MNARRGRTLWRAEDGVAVLPDRFALIASACALALASPTTAQLPRLDEEPRSTIGMLDGPDELVFGDIVDVGVDDAGNVFVLDRLALVIRWFAPDGRFVDRAGGEGRGPGELRAPMGLDVDANGRVHVMDARNARISMYEPTDGELQHVEDTPGVRGYDVCALGDRRYVLRPNNGAVLHEVDRDGTVVRSFAPPEPLDRETATRFAGADAAAIRWSNNLGALHCDVASGRVLLLSQRLPLLRAFSTDGEPLWRVTLAGFNPARWERGRDGRGIRMGPDPESGTAHTGTAITADPAGRIVVTLHEGSLTDPEGRLEALVLSARGETIGRREAPVVVTTIRHGRIYGYQEHPFPRVVVF